MIIVKIIVLVFWAAFSLAMGSQGPLNGFGSLIAMTAFIAVPALYLLPTYEAWKREQANLTTIALINLLLGWTLIGWVVAIAMACKSQKPTQVTIVNPTPAPAAPAPSSNIADELIKLATLKDKGLLTDDEFTTQKNKVLERL